MGKKLKIGLVIGGGLLLAGIGTIILLKGKKAPAITTAADKERMSLIGQILKAKNETDSSKYEMLTTQELGNLLVSSTYVDIMKEAPPDSYYDNLLTDKEKNEVVASINFGKLKFW
jgi:hypothetical protein